VANLLFIWAGVGRSGRNTVVDLFPEGVWIQNLQEFSSPVDPWETVPGFVPPQSYRQVKICKGCYGVGLGLDTQVDGFVRVGRERNADAAEVQEIF